MTESGKPRNSQSTTLDHISSTPGPNVSDGTSTANGLGGDPQLQALIPAFSVHDACVLQFDFTTTALLPGQTGAVNFNFVFTSEEYNEYVNTSYNDVFGFFLNNQNIALLQDLVTPVTIDSVNGGNPYVVGGGANSNQFRNNDLDDGGGAIDIEMDGLTVLLTAFGNITGPGPHHIKLAIADAGDSVLDSNVFIQGASLVASANPTCIAPTPTSAINVTSQNPISWEVRAVANHGGASPLVTVTNPIVTFDANFAGNPVVVSSPSVASPGFPVIGQPASTLISWTPSSTQVGKWMFHYHLVDNLGIAADCAIQVNVLPSIISGPHVIPPTPLDDVEAAIFLPVSWEVRAVNGSGLGGTITIQSVTVEFDANFLGNAVPVQSPVAHIPSFPITGQPAVATASWTPPANAVGQWDFDYHMIDSFGQLFEFSVTVKVRDAIVFLGLSPTTIPLGQGTGDVLHVDPVFLFPYLQFPIGEGAEPNFFIPSIPSLVGLDIYAQAVLYNPTLYPADPIKTSQTLLYCVGISTSVYAPGSGLDLGPTDLAELNAFLPFDFTIL